MIVSNDSQDESVGKTSVIRAIAEVARCQFYFEQSERERLAMADRIGDMIPIDIIASDNILTPVYYQLW
jgi:hypothetical protein